MSRTNSRDVKVPFSKNDLVINKTTDEIGKVTEVNVYFGWFIVKYQSREREYTMNDNEALRVRLLRADERADYFLTLENSGESDSWRE